MKYIFSYTMNRTRERNFYHIKYKDMPGYNNFPAAHLTINVQRESDVYPNYGQIVSYYPLTLETNPLFKKLASAMRSNKPVSKEEFDSLKLGRYTAEGFPKELEVL